MNHKRPVNLDLTTIKFPVMAISSILHRISGVVLFVLFPVMVYFLQKSLDNAESFIELQLAFASGLLYKSVAFVFLAAILFHLLAGIRHLLMDAGFGESLKAGRVSASAVIALSVILTILVGVSLW